VARQCQRELWVGFGLPSEVSLCLAKGTLIRMPFALSRRARGFNPTAEHSSDLVDHFL
jgi:hypothetical protein